MLTTASQFGPRARSFRTNHAAATATASLHRVLVASGAATVQHCQQTRGFRFGSWFSYLDSEVQEEFNRRRLAAAHEKAIARARRKEQEQEKARDTASRQHEVFRATYAEQLSRPLSCDKHPLSDNARHAVKRMMASYWLSHDGCGRHDPAADPKQDTADNKDGVRPGQNIEDVERGAMEHLIFGKESEQATRAQRSKRKRGDKKNKHKSVPPTSYGVSEHEDYFIDPITNRKVAKSLAPANPQEGVNVPVKTFRDYRKRCTSGHYVLHSEPFGPKYANLLDYMESRMDPHPQDSKPKYGDLQKYEPEFVDEKASSEPSQQPDNDIESHKPAKDKEPVQFEDLKPPYEDLDKYNSAVIDEVIARFESEEPPPASGLEPMSREDVEPQHNEPEGRPPGHHTSVVLDRLPEDYRPLVEDLKTGDFSQSTIEQLREKYGTAELRKYTAVRHLEPKVDFSSSAEAQGPGYASIDSGSEMITEDLDQDLDQLHDKLQDYYQPIQSNEHDWQPRTPAEGWSKTSFDLHQHETIEHQEQDGHLPRESDVVQDGLQEMDAKRDYKNGDWLGPAEFDRADESSAEVLRRIAEVQQAEEEYTTRERRKDLEQQMNKYQTASDATDHEASLAVKSARARAANARAEGQLTGNYVRDFPEEFEKSWTETLSTASPETTDMNEELVFESQNMDGGLEGAFGRPPPAKIQPALDRHLDNQPRETPDLSSTHGDEFSVAPTSPTSVKHSGEAPAPANQASGIMTPETTTPETFHHDAMNEPTLYKILAYDPTMQKVEIAETSSFVPDSASALTPTDALLRLSHPTRFFPHFAPLQAEGYEIISGTGDVLVFRKVRPETSEDKLAEKHPEPAQPTPAADDSGVVETRINPIDMTGTPRLSPASAYSASPTGYVNYNSIPNTPARKLPPPPSPPPKIKYNIDVHREEPVFSGPKVRSSDGPRGRKKGLGKRLVVGGVWVAGISYALGVIAEFFTTGGIDGTGPDGL